MKDEAEIIHYAKKLQDLGARHITVSRGGRALLLTSTAVFSSDIPKGTVVNSSRGRRFDVGRFCGHLLETGDFASISVNVVLLPGVRQPIRFG